MPPRWLLTPASCSPWHSRLVHITQPPNRAMVSNNSTHCAPLTLAAFFRIVTHLKDFVGIPPHWLASFVTKLAAGKPLHTTFVPSHSVIPHTESMMAAKYAYSSVFASEARALSSIWLATHFLPLWAPAITLNGKLPVKLKMALPCFDNVSHSNCLRTLLLYFFAYLQPAWCSC